MKRTIFDVFLTQTFVSSHLVVYYLIQFEHKKAKQKWKLKEKETEAQKKQDAEWEQWYGEYQLKEKQILVDEHSSEIIVGA